MIQKKALRIDNSNAAAPMMMFLSQKADGTPDWNQTNGVLPVMTNSKRINDDGTVTEFVDTFDIHIKGKGLLETVANQVSVGKTLDSLTCMVRMKKKGAIKTDENGNPKMTKNNTYDYVDLPMFHLREIELGNDSEKTLRKKLTARVEAEKAQGTLPAIVPTDKMVDIYMEVRKSKEKNKEFDPTEVAQKGLWGHSTVWDKVKGTWKPNGEAQATPGSTPKMNNIQADILNRLDPETLAKVLKAMGEQPDQSEEQSQKKFVEAEVANELETLAF